MEKTDKFYKKISGIDHPVSKGKKTLLEKRLKSEVAAIILIST